MSFESAFTKTIGNEGGYSNNEHDPGNWTSGVVGVGILKGTKYGISAASYPALDIANLTLEQAQTIYRNEYWLRYSCDKIVNETLGEKYFDILVNLQTRAEILLQLAVKPYANIVLDGIVGQVTIDAVNAAPADAVLHDLEVAAGTYYWVLSHMVNQRFLRFYDGWETRAFKP